MYLNTSPATFSTSLKGLECLKQSETIQLFTLDMVRHVCEDGICNHGNQKNGRQSTGLLVGAMTNAVFFLNTSIHDAD
jgi:hypothetical protein